MDLDRLVSPNARPLSVLPSEILGIVASFADIWEVSRLFCSGDRKLNHLLLGESGVHSLTHTSLNAASVTLPGVIVDFKGLRSLSVDVNHYGGRQIALFGTTYECASFSPSSLASLQSVASKLKELRLCNVLLSRKILLEAQKPKRGKSKKVIEKFRFPHLTSLELINTSFMELGEILYKHMPPQLTRLALAFPENSFPKNFLEKLPASLVYLRLHACRLNLLQSWPSKLHSLTSLELETDLHMLYDEKTILSLPPSLTRLHFLGPLKSSQKESKKSGMSDDGEDAEEEDDDQSGDGWDEEAGEEGHDDDVASGDSVQNEDHVGEDLETKFIHQSWIFENLPPSIVDLCFADEVSCDSLNKLACFDSLRKFRVAQFKVTNGGHVVDDSDDEGAEAAVSGDILPRQLEKLVVDSIYPSSSLPSTIKELALVEGILPDLNGFAPHHLEILSIGLVKPMEAPEIPPNLKTLVVYGIDDSGMLNEIRTREDAVNGHYGNPTPFLRNLPQTHPNFVVDGDGWTWIRVKSLGKFFYEDMRARAIKKEIKNQKSENPSSDPLHDETHMMDSTSEDVKRAPYSGIGGSGWTSLGHAIALDSISLVLEILRFMPCLWYELAFHQSLRVAVEFGSEKILNWFEEQHLLPIWSAFEKVLNNDTMEPSDWALNAAFITGQLKLAQWLIDRGFSIPVGMNSAGNPIETAIKTDCLPLLKCALKMLQSDPKMRQMRSVFKDRLEDGDGGFSSDDGDEDEGEDDLYQYDPRSFHLNEMRLQALEEGASSCWSYLINEMDEETFEAGFGDPSSGEKISKKPKEQMKNKKKDNKKTQPNEQPHKPQQLPDLIDLRKFLRDVIDTNDTRGLGLVEDMMKQLDEERRRGADHLSIAEHVAELVSCVYTMFETIMFQITPLEDNADLIQHKVFDWLLDRKFIHMNHTPDHPSTPSLLTLLIDRLQRHICHLPTDPWFANDDDDDEDEVTEDGSEYSYDDGGEAVDEAMGDALNLLSWLIQKGADLDHITGVKKAKRKVVEDSVMISLPATSRDFVSITSLVEDWPSSEVWKIRIEEMIRTTNTLMDYSKLKNKKG